MGESGGLFRLDEYGRAGQVFVGDAIRTLARVGGPLLAGVSFEEVEALPVMRNTLDDGQVFDSSPSAAEALIVLSGSDGKAGDFEGLHVEIATAAESMCSQMTKSILEGIGALCEASGQTIDGSGRSFWESYLETMETIALAFDADGSPQMPTPVMHPDDVERLPPPPEDYQERLAEIVDRRRYEWMAARRTRRLPRGGERT